MTAAAAGGHATAADPPVRVTVKSSFPEPTYVTNQSLGIVRALAEKPGKDVEGLTRTRFRSAFEARFRLSGTGRSWCVTDLDVDVRIGFEEMVVYIPRDFPPGSCEYNAVLAHEQKHVEASRGVLKELTPQVAALISDAMRRKGPRFCGATRSAAQDAAMVAVKQGLARINQRQEEMHDRVQAAIDTPDEYRRVSRLCRNWPHR